MPPLDIIQVDVIVTPSAPVGITVTDPNIIIDATVNVTGTVAVDVVDIGGVPGVGIPPGGTTGQFLSKINSSDYNTQWSTGASGPPSGSAGGDVTGTYPSTLVVSKINGALLGTTTPVTRGDILVANSTPVLARLAKGAPNTVLSATATDAVWAQVTRAMIAADAWLSPIPNAGGGDINKVLTVLAGPTLSWQTPSAVGGGNSFSTVMPGTLLATSPTDTLTFAGTAPVTIVGTPGTDTLTFSLAAITNSMLGTMAGHTFKGNNTGSPSTPLDLDQASLTAELNVFSISALTKGLVPGSNGAGATAYLNGNGGWTVPPGGTSSNSFATIAAPTGSNPAATSPTDTLTLAVNAPIVILGDSVLDKLTFSIATGGIGNSLLANMPAHRFKGNNTASAAAPLDLNQAELTAELNVFTPTLKGLCPFPTGGATTTDFLRADGAFAPPPSRNQPNVTPTGTRPTTSFTVPQLGGVNPTLIIAVLNGLTLNQVASPAAVDEFSLVGTTLTTFMTITSTDKFKVFLWY